MAQLGWSEDYKSCLSGVRDCKSRTAGENERREFGNSRTQGTPSQILRQRGVGMDLGQGR